MLRHAYQPVGDPVDAITSPNWFGQLVNWPVDFFCFSFEAFAKIITIFGLEKFLWV